MTTEIAVLNRLGVALATDSAVTIGDGNASKVFNSADKLFELTCNYPVAVMVNGNMDCVGVPWELIIKDFRDAEGDNPRATIGDWIASLLKFVQSKVPKGIETDEQYMHNTAAAEIEFLKADISRRLWNRFTVETARDLIEEVSAQRTSALLNRRLSAAHSDVSVEDLIEAYQAILSGIVADGLRPVKISEEATITIIRQIATSALSLGPLDSITGLIVAGYGAQDEFPSISSVDLAGVAFGKLKSSAIKERAVLTADKRGHVVPFAQDDVIERLLGGADPRFVGKVEEFIETLFNKFAQSLLEISSKKRISKIEQQDRANAIVEFTRVARDEFVLAAKEMQEDFRIEFERMIAMMPKIELVEFAEALVNITEIERKATTDQGTVGGPIDVAFVSKHEGFVWIKRKFYFSAALNPRYFWRKFHLTKTEG